MVFDQQYLKQLKKPLKSQRQSLCDYFDALDRLNIPYEEPDREGRLTQDFLDHFNHLLQTGQVTSSNGGQTLDAIGLKIGAQRDANIVGDSYLARGEADPTLAKRLSHGLSQAARHPMVVALVAAAAAGVIGYYLGASPSDVTKAD